MLKEKRCPHPVTLWQLVCVESCDYSSLASKRICLPNQMIIKVSPLAHDSWLLICVLYMSDECGRTAVGHTLSTSELHAHCWLWHPQFFVPHRHLYEHKITALFQSAVDTPCPCISMARTNTQLQTSNNSYP